MLPPLPLEPTGIASVSEIAQQIMAQIPARSVILIDGVGGSGKSTFAQRLTEALPDASLVATDDIAWWLSPTDWANEILDGVIKPWLKGNDVDYRPPGWIAKGREGSVKASGKNFLVIEGCAAIRKELRDFASYLIWMQTDPELARERLIQRDIRLGRDGGTRESISNFAEEFEVGTVKIQLSNKPWHIANLVVFGDELRPDGLYPVAWNNRKP